MGRARRMELRSINTPTKAILGRNGSSRLLKLFVRIIEHPLSQAGTFGNVARRASEERLTDLSRRSFLATAALSTASLTVIPKCDAQATKTSHAEHGHPKPERPVVPRLPALICKVTSTAGIDAAFKMLIEGADTLDAALHVCKTQEDDPDRKRVF